MLATHRQDYTRSVRAALIRRKGDDDLRPKADVPISPEPEALDMGDMREATDSMRVVEVPADKLWGAQTDRSLEHFTIRQDLIPREMITAYATLKKAAATANHD